VFRAIVSGSTISTPVIIAAQHLDHFGRAEQTYLPLRKMRWTILMSAGDCFQAACEVDLKLAGESDDE
jgi:hypothetical protein